MGRNQIVRIWHGRLPRHRADDYFRLMERVALPDYRATSGNRAAYALRRDAEESTEVLMVSVWDSIEHIRAFSGDPIDAAKYYDFDTDFLEELEPRVAHYVIDSAQTDAPSA